MVVSYYAETKYSLLFCNFALNIGGSIRKLKKTLLQFLFVYIASRKVFFLSFLLIHLSLTRIVDPQILLYSKDFKTPMAINSFFYVFFLLDIFSVVNKSFPLKRAIKMKRLVYHFSIRYVYIFVV